MSVSTPENPLLVRTGIPPFHQIRAEHVEPAVCEILREASDLLDRPESLESSDWDSLMGLLEKIDLLFEYRMESRWTSAECREFR